MNGTEGPGAKLGTFAAVDRLVRGTPMLLPIFALFVDCAAASFISNRTFLREETLPRWK